MRVGYNKTGIVRSWAQAEGMTMTEEEWFEIDEREIRWIVAELSPRRQRLLAVAACRVFGKLVDFPAAHNALEVAETFADTGKTKAALRRARQALTATRNGPLLVDDGVSLALFVVQVAASENAVTSTVPQSLQALVLAQAIADRTARRWLWQPIRDILGGPSPPVTFSREWRTETAMLIAQQMYDSRDFSAMPILADALQDAGCENDDVLNHCRDANQVHIRGCWVVDLVLGKS
jgi:hypothetical protein